MTTEDLNSEFIKSNHNYVYNILEFYVLAQVWFTTGKTELILKETLYTSCLKCCQKIEDLDS